MVSGWELGRHTTSIAYRKTLCEIYRQPPDALFAHQDESLNGGLVFFAGAAIVHGTVPWATGYHTAKGPGSGSPTRRPRCPLN